MKRGQPTYEDSSSDEGNIGPPGLLGLGGPLGLPLAGLNPFLFFDSDSDEPGSDESSEDGTATFAAYAMMQQMVQLMMAQGLGRKPQKKKRKKDPGEPKKPLNAFLFFSQHERERIKTENPTARPTEMAKLIGQEWRALDKTKVPFYQELAAKDKERYKIQMALRYSTWQTDLWPAVRTFWANRKEEEFLLPEILSHIVSRWALSLRERMIRSTVTRKEVAGQTLITATLPPLAPVPVEVKTTRRRGSAQK